MKPHRPIVVAYDVSKHKIRRRVYKIVLAWRIGGQKSVHECRLTQPQAEELFLQMAEPLDKKTDSLLMAWLEPHRNVLYRGLGNGDIRSEVRHVR